MEEDHRHCKVCGKVVDADEEYCSDKCRTRREDAARSRRNFTYLLYGIMFLLVVVFVASYLR